MLFQSTLPMRGVTKDPGRKIRGEDIFQSTLPMRGVTNADGDQIPVR